MKDDQYIYRIAWFFILVFIAIIIYLGYFTVVKSKQIAVHPYNKRLDHLEGEVVRGNIYDEDGLLLATTEGESRNYPYRDAYSHAIGYSTRGKYGIEALANVELLYPDYSFASLMNYAFNETKFSGHNVVTTLNHELQVAARDGLGNRKGAVLVLEPTTGKIKAMYSSPTFNPNSVREEWEDLSSDTENSPLLNRATQGLYPPASVFKIITTIAYVENNEPNFVYECTGSIKKNGHQIKCYNETAHGQVDLETAFTKSCNTYFVALADYVSPKQLDKVSKNLLFESSLSNQMPHKQSIIEVSDVNEFDTLASYIGQGKTLVSPMHMAMLASIIYNDGILMEPYLIDYSMDQQSDENYKNFPVYKGAYLDESIAHTMKEMMIKVVKEGTASRIAHKHLVIGGKTGTAQNATSKDHSWFVGFAEKPESNQPPIVFSVIVEQGGKGAQSLDVVDALLHAYFD